MIKAQFSLDQDKDKLHHSFRQNNSAFKPVGRKPEIAPEILEH